MDKIWANRLIAGTQVWDNVPQSRRAGVKKEMASRVNSGTANAITPEQYEAITGEPFEG